MQLSKLDSLLEASKSGPKKVTALAWSANNKKLAVVTTERVVYLFDESGSRKDKFATKAADKDGKDYVVRALEFSPDSSKLAVAQSDNMVFIYKLGVDWDEKKSIKHKFAQTSPVTTLVWPLSQANDIVIGCADGKVRLGQLKTNKGATLYQTESYVVSMCSNSSGTAILSGHMDGSIYSFHFDDASGGGVGNAYAKFSHHSCPPTALAWGASVLAAGSDRRVVFYDAQTGQEQRTFDYGEENSSSNTSGVKAKEFTVAECSPSGQSMVVGNFNSIFVFAYSAMRGTWEETPPKAIPNYYSVSALRWKPDGSRLALGTVCGAVDIYDACIRRSRYNNAFEFTYVSPSQVIVKRLKTGTRMVLKSIFERAIERINVYGEEERYIVANTAGTIICGDLVTAKMSEVAWTFTGTEKYIFDNPSVCMIYSAGELTMVEYGSNQVLNSCRTEHVKPTLVSVRINERPKRKSAGEEPDNSLSIPTLTTGFDGFSNDSKEQQQGGRSEEDPRASMNNRKAAYLLDQMTIRVFDLDSGYVEATINHSSKIDWLELNARADLLLFRDKRRQLHLYNIARQQRTALLTFCSYVQWVPDSDVVVAQNRGSLCVWYNIEGAPEKVTLIPINGEVEEIERANGKTEVRVDEGINTVVYQLDEAFIGFGAAVEDGNLDKAMKVLESQSAEGPEVQLRPETEAMWKQLSQVALAGGRLDVAERSHAALGDVSMARYLRKMNKTRLQVMKATACSPRSSQNHWAVRAKLAVLRRDLREAEQVYLDQGQTEDAVEMYQVLHQWDEAIRVAEERNHPEAESMRASYFDYLISSGQESVAAAVREREGDYLEAIDLYLKGGRPAKAMHVVETYKKNYKTELLERVAAALANSGMHDKAGVFFERMGQSDRALEAYLRGHAYRNAVELARREFPAQVVRLEEAWGDWLVQNKNLEQAINHYIESNASKKAIEAALGARQWVKAAQLVDNLQDEDAMRPYLKRIARHYHQSQQFEKAESLYVSAGCEKDAIQMYTEAGLWDAAHKLATQYMSSSEVSALYHRQASALEAKGKFKEAEGLLLTVKSVDKAIAMYKKARKFDHMIRLVAAYRKDLLKDTHLHLAGQLEMEGNLKAAEEHFAQAGDWPAAVNMYTANDMWDEAIRVAKYFGGVAASRKVAYQWAKILGGEAGAKLLTKLGLVEQAIDYAIETGSFSEALALAKSSLPARVTEVHLKYALYLEDEERFGEAEQEFIKAEKPKEAIEMYNHQQDWTNAMRVAERYDPNSVSDVLCAQARLAIESKQFSNAEALYLNAKKPELALQMYQDHNLWNDAQRFAKMHLPHKQQDVARAFQMAGQGGISRSQIPSSPNSAVTPKTSPRMRAPEPQRSLLDSIRAAMDSARTFEEEGQLAKAVDCYVHVGGVLGENGEANQPTPEEVDLMVSAWDRAVRLASQHSLDYPDVVETVAGRLRLVGRFNAAGGLYQEVDRHKQAVECFIQAKKWDKAREACEYAPAYRDMVEQAFKGQMKAERNPNELLKLGDHNAAAALHAEQGDWQRVFQIVDADGVPAELTQKYATEYALRVVEKAPLGKAPVAALDDSIAKLARFGSSGAKETFALFCRLSQEVLGRTEDKIVLGKSPQDEREEDADRQDYVATLRNLREVLFNAIKTRSQKSQRSSESKFTNGNSNIQTLERLLLVVHLVLMHYVCQEHGSSEIAANILVALLRFNGDAIPCDKAFYTAGMALKSIQQPGKAFVLLNRYLDLSEAIDDGELGDIDNADFKNTDLPPPHSHPLPKEHYLPEDKREEIREWVLSAAMDAGIQQEPLEMEWLEDVRSQVADQVGHIVRRFDRAALPIEEFLVPVRQQYINY